MDMLAECCDIFEDNTFVIIGVVGALLATRFHFVAIEGAGIGVDGGDGEE